MADDPAPWKRIKKDYCEEKLGGVQIRKQDMIILVLDFLLNEGYVEAAQKLAADFGPGMEFGKVTDRMAVKTALENGNVDEAIKKLNEIDPTILNTSPQLFNRLQHQRLIELIRNRKIEEALACAEEYLAPLGEQNILNTSPQLFDHRLQHQRLIELIRNRKTEEALACAQEYLAPLGEQNNETLHTLEKTVALLASEDPSNCPIGGELLDMSRRLEHASKVNAAILRSQDLDEDSNLLNVLKILKWFLISLSLKHRELILEDPA